MATPSPVLKHVLLKRTTHKRLRTLQVEWEQSSMDETIQQLLDWHLPKNPPRNA